MIKKFLEEQGWHAAGAGLAGLGTIYLFKRGPQRLQVELCANQTIKLTYDDETRIVPDRIQIAKALNKEEATDDDVIRLFSRVLDTMIEQHRDPNSAEIQDNFARFSRYSR